MSDFATVCYEIKDHLAYVTLNRPDALNVYNIQMRDDLFQVLSAIKEDSEINSVVVKGAGEKAFCAGADLSEFLTAPPAVSAREVRWARDVWGLFLGIPQPVIAALHGFVLGSGLEIALCCDIRIASDDIRIGLPEVGLGIIPAAGGTQTLPRTIQQPLALDMLMTGRWIDSKEAHRCGLVNEVTTRDTLLATVEELARKIGSYNPLAVQKAKQAVLRGLDLSLADGLDLERRLAGLPCEL
ncbi:MAG: enoyl-CoA hydratase/isomerase family protein [Deltaproteobacteria bacterium]|nr:enoyl-CoA hydratase/isomerase family protein [Deltaproteobacteria bacterium]MBW1815776.1 enoyl-CoA hydratase/isomerase family protein [Deltaproteobacteria bacterium]